MHFGLLYDSAFRKMKFGDLGFGGTVPRDDQTSSGPNKDTTLHFNGIEKRYF